MRNNKKKEEEVLKELRSTLEESLKRAPTEEEVSDAHNFLNHFSRLSYELFMKEHSAKVKLKENPKGFRPDEGGKCVVCGDHTEAEKSWKDGNGHKCLNCQKSIENQEIPLSVITDKDSFYTKLELETHFNLKGPTLTKAVRDKFLISRRVMNEKNKVHCELFLISDNQETLPPKEMIKCRLKRVVSKSKGKTYITNAYWYEYFSQEQTKVLFKYRISEMFYTTFSQRMDRGRLLAPENMNPIMKYKDGSMTDIVEEID